MFNLTTTVCFIYIGLTTAIGVNYIIHTIQEFNYIYEDEEIKKTKNK